MSSSLLLGPALRHVTPHTATIWVETDAPCVVEVLGHREATFCVAGHHYALVCVSGLEPGTSTEYDVRLDGDLVWPLPSAAMPPSRIRTPDPARAVRVAFGSCRYATASVTGLSGRYGDDALDALAKALPSRPDAEWPDLLIMLGDQVYADETTPATRRRIAERRSLREAPGGQVRDFEEYTWLYAESWADSEVRWLMSTVPSAMIFDDHDVHDDWNTSRSWRSDMQATSWWQERIVGGLMSYWIYQHLGNLSPEELAADPTYAAVRAADDGEKVLREFATAADREADGGKGARWSHWRDLGPTRLVVIDSRCGRMLDGERSMLSPAEMEWIEHRLAGSYDHLLIGTSVPWLMAPALHAIEAWDERLCDKSGWRGRLGERVRQGADLEHWPAFHASFEWLAGLIADVGRGRLGPGAEASGQAPATICVLSGDVHHSYLCAADYAESMPSRVYQITCSPVHNMVPWFMRLAFTLSWSRVADHAARLLLGRIARVPKPALSWRRIAGPHFGNALGNLVLSGRHATLLVETTAKTDGRPVRPAITHDLA
jgi:PhoD-like phosphatase